MAKAKNKSGESQAGAYKTSKRWESNRKARLERTLKKQPNNEQVKLALKGMVYRRKTPANPVWSASWIATAKLFKEFGGRFDMAMMSSNADVARAAMQKPSPVSMRMPAITGSDKNFFALGTRVNMRKGN